MNSKTILVVDDEPLTRTGIHRMLEAWSTGRHRILCAENGFEALDLMEKHGAHLVITDIKMPGMGGLQLVEKMQDMGHKPVVIIVSGHPDFSYAQRAIQLGVVDYLLKPIDKHKLLESVEQALGMGESRERIEVMEKVVDRQLMNVQSGRSPRSPQIAEALQYVLNNLHTPLGLRDVAQSVYLNPSYFSVLFKDQMHMTFSEYVTRSRLQRAKELLLQTALPVMQISEQVGYQTVKYFIKCFKEQTGVSPSQYRKEMGQEFGEEII